MLVLAFEIADPEILIYAVQICQASLGKARQMRSPRLIQYANLILMRLTLNPQLEDGLLELHKPRIPQRQSLSLTYRK